MKKWLVGFWFFLALGCSSSIDDYQKSGPEFSFFEFFNGNVKAWGMVQDFTGKQTRRFEVDIIGKVTGNSIILDEHFVFDDGKTDRRVWSITQNENKEYQGRAEDVIGIAKGREMGNALHLTYQLEVDIEGSTYVFTMDDWLFRQNTTQVFNIAKMKKFGLELGRVTIFFEKQVNEKKQTEPSKLL